MIKKIGKYAATSAMIAHASALAAFAQVNPDEFTPQDPVGGDLIGWIQQTINLIIGLAGLIAVGYLVYSGIQYIMANGDENKIDKATKGITYSVIGLIICFISVLIVNFVIERVLGN